MDLAELKFVVDTKQLEEAAKQIESLGTAVSKLNKPMQELSRESAKTNKELSKAEEAAAKAALAQTKLEQAQSKSLQSTGKSNTVLERQNLILEYMAQGNSKGQASILATAKAAGALDDEMLALNKTLVTQRTLIGGDPFDKSIGLMQKLQNEYKTTTEVTNLFNKNLGLTEKQMTDLAREKERLIALYGIEGKSLNGLAAEYDQLIQKSAMINRANSNRTDSMKAQVKAQDDAAKANTYLAQEMERVNRLNKEGESITSATNNRLIRFEKELKASGASAAEAATKLEAYKTALLSAQKAAGNRQIDYLSRALGPQITDIGVGLATGQAPLTILLQQGGQLRDQFALAGVAGAEMGKMLVQASKAMVTSIKDIGLAVGQLVTGAITGTGKAIFDGIVAPFKRLSEGREALKQLDEAIISNLRYARLMEVANGRMIQSFISFGKVAATIGVIALGMLAKGLFDVIKEQDTLTTQLVLTGASLGVNTTTAISYANALNSVGITTASALKVMQAMAKEGGFVANEINMVVTSASNLKLAGVAIEDVVKQFTKLKEKPVEALIEIAKATGLVKPEIIAIVSDLEQQGKTSEAAAIAMKAYADVTIAQKDRLKIELSDFALFIKSLSSNVGEFFDEVFRGLWRRTSPTEAIKREITSIENTIKLGTKASPEKKAENDATLLALKEQLRLSQMASDSELTRNNDNIRTAKALGEWQKLSVTNLDKEKKAELDIATIRKVGLEAKKSEADIDKLIADYKEKNKPPKVPKTDAEKEQLRLLKESEKYLDKISGLTNEATREQENYTKAQKLALDILSDPDFKNYPETQRIKITNALEQAHAEELVANELTKQRAIQKQIYDEYIKLQAKRDDAMFDAIDKSIALNNAVKEESDELIFQATLIGKTDTERKKAVKTRQAELLLAKELADIDKLKSLDNGQDIVELQAQAYQRFADRTKNINTEIANDFAIEMQKQYDLISNGLTDATITGLFEGGKAGSKKLRDLVIAELKKPITIVVKAIVDATVGNFMNGMMGGAGGNTMGSALGSSIGNAVSGFQIGSSSLGEVFSAFGKGLMSGGAPEALGSTAFATEAGSTASSAYGAGASASELAMTAGPYVLAAVVALNALGAFRTTKTVGGGIAGTLGAGNLEAYDLTRKSGTLFNGPSYGASSKGATEATIALDKAFVAMREAITGTVDSLGFSTDKIKNFTMAVGDIKIHPDIEQLGLVLDGLSDEQKVAKINEVLTKSGNAMAELILGTGTTLEKLKSTFDFFYQNFYSESEKFDNLTKDLTASFAKLGFSLPSTRDQFKQLVIAAQKAGDTALLKALTDLQYAFAELVPAASTASKSIIASAEAINEAYKNLKSSAMTAEDIAKQRIDLERKLFEATATAIQLEADRRNAIDNSNLALYNQIIAANNIKTSTEALAKAQDNVLKAEKELTKARADSLSNFISATKGYVDSLRKYAQSLLLGAQSTLTPEQKYTTSKAQLDSLIKIATGTATTPEEIAARDKAASSIEGAATAFLEASRTYNASSSQYTEDFKFVQQAISLTANALDAQVTDAQKQLKALGNIDVGISAVETAVNNLAAAQREVALAQQAFNAAVLAGDASGLNNSASSAAASVLGKAVVSNGIVYGAQGGLTSSSTAQFKTDIQSWMNQTASKDYFTANPDVAASYAQNSYGMTKDAFAQAHYKAYGMAEGRVSPDVEAQMVKDLYAKIVGEWGLDSATLAQIMGTSQQSILDYFTPYGLPAFAKGTNYVPEDMYAKIHQGERIIPAADNTRLFQSLSDRNETNTVLVTEIRNLRQEIVELREQQSQETATIVVSNLDAQQRSADSISSTISSTSQESNWNSKVRESVKLK